MTEPQIIAVVIPCFRVKSQVLNVISGIGDEITHIFVIDDACPDKSGDLVQKNVKDARVRVVRHPQNKGVGGAVKSGYRLALDVGVDIVVKVDGDGQGDPRLIPQLVRPITRGFADYTKGNRFHSAYDVRSMPKRRLIGNAILSFMTKLTSGYWKIFDPTNGFTAIHRAALEKLNLDNVADRYFFETDMLINLNGIRAVVVDVPMTAVYGDEESNLKIRDIVGEFSIKHIREFFKRIIYSYFMRDFNIASVNLLFGLPLFLFGIAFGAYHWYESANTGEVATTGTVMLAALPIIIGFQMLIQFITYDVENEPTIPLCKLSD